MKTALIFALSGAMAFAAPQVWADDDDDDRRSSQRVERSVKTERISQARAIQIARAYGLVQIEEVEFDDGKWEIEGRDRLGREVEIDVHGRTGRLLEVDRDDDDDDRGDG